MNRADPCPRHGNLRYRPDGFSLTQRHCTPSPAMADRFSALFQPQNTLSRDYSPLEFFGDGPCSA